MLTLVVCTSCQPDIFQIADITFPVKYCVHCNLFHPILLDLHMVMKSSYFFNLTSHVYNSSCNQHIIEVAWMKNIIPGISNESSSLSELPTISAIPVSLSPLDPVTLTTK